MACIPTDGVREPVRDVDWRNFTRTVQYVVPEVFRVTTLDDVVWVLADAKARGVPVKAVGSGWCVENITQTHTLVDTDGLSARLDLLVDRTPGLYALTERWLQQQRRDSGPRLVHVEAGIKLFALNQLLDADGLALPVLGGAQGQSLLGALATSTHGSDIDWPPLPDLVRAVHLVTTGGEEVWIESASDPITEDDDALRVVLPCPDTRIIRDDDMLHAVVVGFGRFGVVYSVVVEATRSFNLAEWTQRRPWSDVRDELRGVVGRPSVEGNPLEVVLGPMVSSPPSDLHISTSPVKARYLDITFNPRDGEECWVRRRWLTDDDETLHLEESGSFLCHPGVGNVICLAVSAFLRGYSGLVGAIPFVGWVKAIEINARASELLALASHPHLTGGQALAAAGNAIWASEFVIGISHLLTSANGIALDGVFEKSEGAGRRGPSWQVTSGIDETSFDPDCYLGSSIEVVFSMGDSGYLDFIDAILANANDFAQLGYVSVRFGRHSRALLSMHHVEYEWACSVEVTSLHGLSDSDRWLEFLERRGLELGGRPHWGQHNRLRSADVDALYGEDVVRWRELLLDVAGSSAMFSGPYTATRGLEPRLPLRHVTSVRRDRSRITHLCNDAGQWPPVSVEEAIAHITQRVGDYVTKTPAETASQPLVVRRFVTTGADETEHNNLEELPENRRVFGPPPPDLVDRQVTHVMRTGSTWPVIELLTNAGAGWSVHVDEAFHHIRSGSHRYYIETPDGRQTDLEAREFLTTRPDRWRDNNLSELPTCPP